jgi:RDD family protein
MSTLSPVRRAWPGAAELAPPRLRAAAWAVDLVVVAVLAALLALVAMWFVRDVLALRDVWSVAAPWSRKAGVVAVAAAVAVLGYLGLGQAGSARTVGKRLVGLRPVQVVRMPEGGLRLIELRIAVAVLRQVAHLADIPLLFLRPLWDRYRRTLADQLTAVFVVVDRDERCFEHERFLDRSAGDQPEWWLCKQPDDEIWRGAPPA